MQNQQTPIDLSLEHINLIENHIRKIDHKEIAKEIVSWLIRNVENYIDNTTNYYKIDIVLENEELPETYKTQKLYRECGNLYDALMESEKKSKNKLDKIEKCRKMLNEITEQAFFSIKENKEQLVDLFKRMVFFYEKIIPNPEAKKRAFEIDAELKELVEKKERANTELEKSQVQDQIIKKIDEGVALVKFTELDGAVDITKFEYEAFNVDVAIKKTNRNEDGEEKSSELVKGYTIPEGFTVWMEISQRPKLKRPTAMF